MPVLDLSTFKGFAAAAGTIAGVASSTAAATWAIAMMTVDDRSDSLEACLTLSGPELRTLAEDLQGLTADARGVVAYQDCKADLGEATDKLAGINNRHERELATVKLAEAMARSDAKKQARQLNERIADLQKRYSPVQDFTLQTGKGYSILNNRHIISLETTGEDEPFARVRIDGGYDQPMEVGQRIVLGPEDAEARFELVLIDCPPRGKNAARATFRLLRVNPAPASQ